MEDFLFLLLRLRQSSRGTSSPSVCGYHVPDPVGGRAATAKGPPRGVRAAGWAGAVEKRGACGEPQSLPDAQGIRSLSTPVSRGHRSWA